MTVLLRVLLLLLTALIANGDGVNLTFMLVTSYGGTGRYNSSGTLPAAEIALREINSRPDILPGYNLVYDKVRNSACDRQTSLNEFFDGILSAPVKIGVIGCGCSVASEPVAEIIHHWNIPLISYGTTSSTLSDVSVYRNFFRDNPPSTTFAPALLALMRQYSWRRVGLLTQDENRFRRVEDTIRSMMEPHGIEVESRKYPTGGDPRSVRDLFIEDEDYRIFLLNSYPNPNVLCEIFKESLLHPRYTWIAYGWYAQASWTNGDMVNCTDDQLRMVMKKGISVEVFPIPEDMNASTVANLTPAEFKQEYRAIANAEGYEILDTTATQLHDDVWGLALALNETMTMVNTGDIGGTDCENLAGDLVSLEEFSYTNAKMGCLITWNLRRTNFSGASGEVHFDENLINHTATLLQYVLNGNDLTSKPFATADRAHNFSFEYQDGYDDQILYPDGVPPDGTPERVIHAVILAIAVIVDILAFTGILFAVMCLVFDIKFRNRKIVKLTSPRLNYFIILGTIFMYLSIFFYLIPTKVMSVVQASCLVREWLFTLGYAFAYGAMLAKLWRVYKIFHNPAPNKMIFKDWHLIVLTMIVAGIALLLLLLGTAIPELRGKVSEIRDVERSEDETEEGVKIEYYVLVCYEDVGGPLYWRIFIFAYFTVFQILGIMMAFQTRKVKLKGLKDSTFVTANVYISSIVIVVFILITFALRNYLNTYNTVFAIGTFILTTTFLVLTYIPKMVMLYKDPLGKAYETSATDAFQKDGTIILGNRQELPVEFIEKVALLEKKVAENEITMDRMKREIEQLHEQTKILDAE